MFVKSGTRGNKIGLLCSLSVSPLPLPYSSTHHFGFEAARDTPSRVKQGGSKKSFGISSWHLLRKGEKLQRKKDREKDFRVSE